MKYLMNVNQLFKMLCNKNSFDIICDMTFSNFGIKKVIYKHSWNPSSAPYVSDAMRKLGIFCISTINYVSIFNVSYVCQQRSGLRCMKYQVKLVNKSVSIL